MGGLRGLLFPLPENYRCIADDCWKLILKSNEPPRLLPTSEIRIPLSLLIEYRNSIFSIPFKARRYRYHRISGLRSWFCLIPREKSRRRPQVGGSKNFNLRFNCSSTLTGISDVGKFQCLSRFKLCLKLFASFWSTRFYDFGKFFTSPIANSLDFSDRISSLLVKYREAPFPWSKPLYLLNRSQTQHRDVAQFLGIVTICNMN